MPLNGVDHVEFFVGNAKQAAFFYSRAFGFKLVAYSGLETGARDRASLRPPAGPDPARVHRRAALGLPHRRAPAQARRRRQGDRLSVPDVDHAYREATTRGAECVVAPHDATDEHGTVRLATIKTYGETLHTFVGRGDYDGAFLPGYEARSPTPRPTPACCWRSTTSSATSSTWTRG